MLRAAMLMFAVMLFSGATAADDPPKDVLEFFRSLNVALTEAHDDGNARTFMDHFDSSMPGYAALRDQIEALIGAGEVSAVIEFVTDEGDDTKRTLQLDWLLQIEDQRSKRAVLKCVIEKKSKKWKITSLEPIDFFKKD